jgi:choice-of-anchor B domain-containing protein
MLESPVSGTGAGFGAALLLAGQDMLIGAPDADSSSGVVYHYRRTGDSWQRAGELRPTGMSRGEMGSAIVRAGDGVMIGAAAADSGAGAVVVFSRRADGGWAQRAIMTAPRSLRMARGRFGTSLLSVGTSLYVGAPGSETVVRYQRDTTLVWREAAVLRSFDYQRGSRFGAALAAVGEELWVGAPGANDDNGTVYRFSEGPNGGFSRAERFDADSAHGASWPFGFGSSIAAAGGRAAIGMPDRDFGEGRVLTAALTRGDWTATGTLAGEIFRIGGGDTAPGKCLEGHIEDYTCRNIELVAHMPTTALGGERGVWVNDVWGWTDPQTGRDYALVARRDGAAFVDVTVPSQPRLVGSLPRTAGAPPSVWRDIKTYKDHAFIVADGAGAHGMQVFDLRKLRSVRNAPVTFTADALYAEMHSAHNVVADTASGFLYIVGANGGGRTCGGGLHIVDARDPKKPTFAGCYADSSSARARGYTHDAQCVTYAGPDARYRGREICVAANAVELNIADVTNKQQPVTIGKNSYPNVGYTHQGWFDAEQRYFYMNDEGDETAGLVPGTRTIVWDLAELDDPVVAYEYIGPVRASDHNLFVVGDRVYESNYGSGLRVLDISDRTRPREIGFFDSAPYNEDEPGFSATASGAWSNYPFFKSGVIVFTSVREGLFIVKVDEQVPVP